MAIASFKQKTWTRRSAWSRITPIWRRVVSTRSRRISCRDRRGSRSIPNLAWGGATPCRPPTQSIARNQPCRPGTLTMKGATMLGRKKYTQEEIDQGKAAVEQQLAAYKQLVKAVAGATTDERFDAAVESFEALFFNNMTLVLDRYFVHRLPGADYGPTMKARTGIHSTRSGSSVTP